MQHSPLAIAPESGQESGDTGKPRPTPDTALVPLQRGDPGRGELESFIARRYEAFFDARLGAFPPLLLGRRGRDGEWVFPIPVGMNCCGG